MPAQGAMIAMVIVLLAAAEAAAEAPGAAGKPQPTTGRAVGADSRVGPRENPRRVQRLRITRPGVWENYLVDGRWIDRNLVKINANDVTLRYCEIRNGRNNGVTVYADNVLIESCRIHRLLRGTFREQDDAHGITGRPRNLTIRNCEISHVSGDAVQFDPGRDRWDNVLIENCTFWTGPLQEDAAGFRKGERPGENAVDTKNLKANGRARLTIRNCLFYGWGDGQISTQAALNLKEQIEVTVENCVFRDNDICFRLRGDTGRKGGALVTIRNCAVYRSDLAVRMEDRIANLTIERLGIGDGIRRKYQFVGGRGPGYVNRGEYRAPPFEQALVRLYNPGDK